MRSRTGLALSHARRFGSQVVPFPALSPTMQTGVISEWLKKPGDKIKSGDVVAKIETDKATVDFEATDDSWLAKILKESGEVKVGEPFMITCDEQEEVAGLKNFVVPASAAAAAPAAPKPAAPAAAVAAPAPVVVAAPPPPPKAATPPPAAAPAPAAAAAAAPVLLGGDDYVAWPHWGKSLSRTPLGASLLKQQEAYFAAYGFSGVALEAEKKEEAPKDKKK